MKGPFPDKLEENYFKLKNGLFPVAMQMPQEIILLLKKFYPTVNWNKVRFYNTLPWYTQYGLKYLDGITTPSNFGIYTIDIYLNHLNLYRPYGLATLVHEGYHILQFQKQYRAGIGFLKIYLIDYIAGWFKHGYFQHPMEKPAYVQERNMNKFLGIHFENLRPGGIEKMISANRNEHLIIKKAEHQLDTPWYNFTAAFLLTLLIAILKPLAELVLIIELMILRGCIYLSKL